MNVLACAYSCVRDPDQRFGDGGEGFLGWNMVIQLARFHDVWVLTHIKNRQAIEKKMAEQPIKNIHFYYIALPAWVEYVNRFHGGIQLCAYLWQVQAFFHARKLHKKMLFDVFHHITYANDWMASFVGALLPIAYIRGPGGGAHKVPAGFLKEYSLKNKSLEILRSFGQWMFRHDPFFIMGQQRAKAILVCNHEAFSAIPKKWQSKAHLFPVNGISKKDLETGYAKNIAPGEFSFATVGKLISLKNFDLGIRAFKICNDKFPASHFFIIGDGPESIPLQTLIKELGLESKVTMLPWMSHEKLLNQMSQCDVFVFPSLRDGGGGVVVEAMAMGKPVVCFDIAGPGFHVDETCGIKIKPQSPSQAIQDMANALKKLYLDKDLRLRLGVGARKKALTHYDWDVLGDRLFAIYKKIV